MSQNPHVLIAGAGLGGLCLAQGLNRAGIPFTLFERDPSSGARTQGYRIHISPIGARSLQACLPSELFDLFCETAGEHSQGFTMVTEHLQELLSLVGGRPTSSQNAIETHRSASRRTLRRILLSGIQENIRFGCRVTSFAREPGGGVTVRLEDGSSVSGDILVGADGVHSSIRKQLLPNADPVNTGVVALGGQIPLSSGVMALMPPQLLDGPVMVMPKERCSLFLAVWRRSTEKTDLLAKALRDDAELEEESDYLIFGFGASEELLRSVGDPRELEGQEAISILRERVSDWHPNLRMLVELIDPDSLGARRIKTSPPIPTWEPGNVTLLGDAIHSMTPYRGIGGNVALRDAELLSRRIVEAVKNGQDFVGGIASYESEMRLYAAAAVKSSLEMCERVVMEKNAGFTVMKGVLRAMNALPPLKQRMLARMSEN